MPMLRLTEGMPDEPDTNDWDAICDSPSIEGFFGALFCDVAGVPMPALTERSEDRDDEAVVHKGRYGDRAFGVEVETVTILESSDFMVRCFWETHGLPGMKVTWRYYLERAGQLGHVAYRHGQLECRFDTEADQARFTGVWEKAIGKIPVFAPA